MDKTNEDGAFLAFCQCIRGKGVLLIACLSSLWRTFFFSFFECREMMMMEITVYVLVRKGDNILL